MSLEKISLESVKSINPAAFEAWRDLSVLLKEVRIKSGLTKGQLAQKIGAAPSRITEFESCSVRPKYGDLQAYYEAAISVGTSPVDLLGLLCKAIDEEKGYTTKPTAHNFRPIALMPCAESLDINESDLIERATTDPKAFLMSARWLPARAEDRMERTAFFRCYIDKVEGVKEHCITIAREAQQLLDLYKKIGKLFTAYAADLPGYELTKRQFYYGERLTEILRDQRYTRRWAQTLQERTLSTFQQRVREQYDKRGISE